jgi:hypothetical protein
MPLHNATAYAGAIHTASITEPYARGSYRELAGFDYKKSQIPQIFIHHISDPCVLTTYSGAKSISEKYGVALVTVSGGIGVTGNIYLGSNSVLGFANVGPTSPSAVYVYFNETTNSLDTVFN